MSTTQFDPDEDAARIDKVLATLADHYESVQIFATYHVPSDGSSVSVAKGTGNWYTRFGQVREWLVKQDEQARIQTRQENL